MGSTEQNITTPFSLFFQNCASALCLDYSNFPECVWAARALSRDKLCWSRGIFNVTTQGQHGRRATRWVDCFVYGTGHQVYRATASQAYVRVKVACATDTNAVQHGLDVIDSWAKGPLASSWFSFSLEVSSGTENSCYSILAEQVMAVMRMKNTLHVRVGGVFLFFFNPEILRVLQNCRYFMPDCIRLHLLYCTENYWTWYTRVCCKKGKKYKDTYVADVIYVEHL